jgi:predicted adenylyl cyclase CyaB
MPENLELKARISSISGAIRTARHIQAQSQGILRQRDIYYNVSHGRLKLRIINNHSAELIFYNRPNRNGSLFSNYIVLPVSNMRLSNELCTAAFGQKIIVKKKRCLFLYKNSRIHLDEVLNLGTFIEFEVLVKHGVRQAQKLLAELCMEFAITKAATTCFSYSDLLLQKK